MKAKDYEDTIRFIINWQVLSNFITTLIETPPYHG